MPEWPPAPASLGEEVASVGQQRERHVIGMWAQSRSPNRRTEQENRSKSEHTPASAIEVMTSDRDGALMIADTSKAAVKFTTVGAANALSASVWGARPCWR